MEVKPGTIPDGWKSAPLGQLCGRITTGKLDANAMVTDGDYPFFTCARESYRINKYAFDCEALLVSGNGANVGYVHYYKGKFNAYQRTYVISDFSADVHFLKLFLDRNVRDRIRVEVNAGNTPYITMGTLTEMGVVLPSNPVEQRAIAEALSDVDALLGALDRLIAKKRDLKQAAMQQLLTGQTRLPGFHGEWEAVTMRQVLTQNATYGIVTAGNFVQNGVKMLRGGDIADGRINTDLPMVSLEKAAEYARTSLVKDDVVIALVGYPGASAKIPEELIGANISRAVGLLRMNGKVSANFLVCFLNSPDGRRMVLAPSAGSAQQVVNLAALNKLQFSVPPPPEQTAIAEMLTEIDAELATLEHRREKTRVLKQAMMQDLLTGKTRLQ